MARARKKSTSRGGGNTLVGVMVGLILGLIAAVIVALFVTRVPMPFSDKASREPARTLLPDVRDAPDPNIGLYGKSALPEAVPMMPPPSAANKAQPPEAPDRLAELIARLDEPAVTAIPGVTGPAPSYYLQAGAFRSATDAQGVLARILLLGLPAHIEQAQIDGATINRVRVGPFAGIDDMNHARSRLGEQNMETAVIRQ